MDYREEFEAKTNKSAGCKVYGEKGDGSERFIAMPDYIEFLENQLQEKDKVIEKYNELLFAVEDKYPNESRHETALRLLKNYQTHSHLKSGSNTKRQ